MPDAHETHEEAAERTRRIDRPIEHDRAGNLIISGAAGGAIEGVEGAVKEGGESIARGLIGEYANQTVDAVLEGTDIPNPTLNPHDDVPTIEHDVALGGVVGLTGAAEREPGPVILPEVTIVGDVDGSTAGTGTAREPGPGTTEEGVGSGGSGNPTPPDPDPDPAPDPDPDPDPDPAPDPDPDPGGGDDGMPSDGGDEGPKVHKFNSDSNGPGTGMGITGGGALGGRNTGLEPTVRLPSREGGGPDDR